MQNSSNAQLSNIGNLESVDDLNQYTNFSNLSKTMCTTFEQLITLKALKVYSNVMINPEILSIIEYWIETISDYDFFDTEKILQDSDTNGYKLLVVLYEAYMYYFDKIKGEQSNLPRLVDGLIWSIQEYLEINYNKITTKINISDSISC